MWESWGILCTSCGLLIKHYGPDKNNRIVAIWRKCEHCDNLDSIKLINPPLGYFDDNPERKLLTKEEIVEILI